MDNTDWIDDIFGSNTDSLFGPQSGLHSILPTSRPEFVRRKICNAVKTYLDRRETYQGVSSPSVRDRNLIQLSNACRRFVTGLNALDADQRMDLQFQIYSTLLGIGHGGYFIKHFGLEKFIELRDSSTSRSKFSKTFIDLLADGAGIMDSSTNNIFDIYQKVEKNAEAESSEKGSNHPKLYARFDLIEIYFNEHHFMPNDIASPSAFIDQYKPGPSGTLVDFIDEITSACSETIRKEIYGSNGRPVVDAWTNFRGSLS